MTDKIQFFYEETDYVLKPVEEITNWLLHSIMTENKELSSINYILCSDEYLHKVNVEYLNHDYYTDIITFDNSEDNNIIEGDIFISIDRIRDNAANEGVPFIKELRRVMIHGVLHLVGFNDKTDDEQKLMRQKENEYLSLPEFKIIES